MKRAIPFLLAIGCADSQITHELDQAGPIGIDAQLDISADFGDDVEPTLLAQLIERAILSTDDVEFVIGQSAVASRMTGGHHWLVQRTGTEVCVSWDTQPDIDTFYWSLCVRDDVHDSVTVFASDDATQSILRFDDEGRRMLYEVGVRFDLETIEVSHEDADVMVTNGTMVYPDFLDVEDVWGVSEGYMAFVEDAGLDPYDDGTVNPTQLNVCVASGVMIGGAMGAWVGAGIGAVAGFAICAFTQQLDV